MLAGPLLSDIITAIKYFDWDLLRQLRLLYCEQYGH